MGCYSCRQAAIAIAGAALPTGLADATGVEAERQCSDVIAAVAVAVAAAAGAAAGAADAAGAAVAALDVADTLVYGLASLVGTEDSRKFPAVSETVAARRTGRVDHGPATKPPKPENSIEEYDMPVHTGAACVRLPLNLASLFPCQPCLDCRAKLRVETLEQVFGS